MPCLSQAFRVAALVAFILCSFVTRPGIAQTPEFDRPTVLKYKSLFLQEEPGTVAFLPNIGSSQFASRAHEFGVLPHSGFYALPAKGTYVFQINNVTGTSEPRLLECIIYTAYAKGDAEKTPILLTRNEGNWQGGRYSDGQVRTTTTKVVVSRIEGENSIETLRDIHNGEDLRPVDKFTKRTWHAWLESGDESSWDLRKKLAQEPPANFWKLLDKCGLSKDTVQICLTVHLLHFSTAEKPTRTGRPLTFSITGDNARATYIHLVSPDEDFTKEYYLKFDPLVH